MEWASILSLLSGSVSGIVGHWFKAKEAEKERQFQLEKGRLDMERSTLDSKNRIEEIKANVQVEEIRTEGMLLTQEAEGFNHAVAEISKNKVSDAMLLKLLEGNWFMQVAAVFIIGGLGMVDIARGSVRPLLTLGAFWATYYIAAEAVTAGINSEALDPYGLAKIAVLAILYVLTAATQFWFMDKAGARGTRAMMAKIGL